MPGARESTTIVIASRTERSRGNASATSPSTLVSVRSMSAISSPPTSLTPTIHDVASPSSSVIRTTSGTHRASSRCASHSGIGWRRAARPCVATARTSSSSESARRTWRAAVVSVHGTSTNDSTSPRSVGRCGAGAWTGWPWLGSVHAPARSASVSIVTDAQSSRACADGARSAVRMAAMSGSSRRGSRAGSTL